MNQRGSAAKKELMVEYIPQFREQEFCIRLEGDEYFLSVVQFKAFFADCEQALQAYEAERAAIRLDLKSRYEAARKRR